ncbi:uncharacterized protein [Malus domestica]|uniref:uncharacterized protein n=1 Tax=Malus domestica TaxID=3750 RepID=UPI003975C9B2
MALTHASVIALPDDGGEFEIYSYACLSGLGRVLIQHGKVIAYASRQRKWMELISDYDCTIEYHPGHANVVTDALSRQSYGQLAFIRAIHVPLLFSLRETDVTVTPNLQEALLAHFQIKPVLVDLVWEARKLDQQCVDLKKQMHNGSRRDLKIRRDGALAMGNRLFMPKDNEVVKKEILDEAHISVVCEEMYYLPVGEGGQTETCKADAESPYTSVEVGRHHHGFRVCIPITIVSDRNPRFTSKFWRVFNDAMNTQLLYNNAYHPQTEGQSERTIQTSEDMLGMDHEYENGDFVFLKLSPWKRVVRIGKQGKLSPQYVGPYRITKRIGTVAYRLELPPELSQIHDVFHVSMLRKYVSNPSYVIQPEPLEVNQYASYVEEPMAIIDHQDKTLRSKVIPLVKVLCRNHAIEETMWETEELMRSQYSYLFILDCNFGDKILLRG